MILIKFQDTCVIERPTGQTDEWDNPVMDTIYEGACLFQEGGNSYIPPAIVKSAAVYLPSNDVLINVNDIITITTLSERVVKSSAATVRDIRFSSVDNHEYTFIGLKHSKDKT